MKKQCIIAMAIYMLAYIALPLPAYSTEPDSQAMLDPISAPIFTKDSFITIATTTSVENSGLLAHILPSFTKETGITVRVIAKGTGGAIRDGKDGNVDAILTHDPFREAQFVKDGHGTKRYYIAYNDFILVGSEKDPAKLAKLPIVTAFSRIASAKAPFISRGDDSGTHTKEAEIWAQISPKYPSKYPTDTTWYASIGQGMGKTLLMANERQAYTLTDRATFNSLKHKVKPPLDLILISEGSSFLYNPYAYIPINKTKHPHIKQTKATVLANWLVSQKGKNAIRSFKIEGKSLFMPSDKLE